MRLILMCYLALTGAIVSPAFAHTDVGQTNSFASGIAHPLNADHILVMVTVGLWAVIAGGRAMLVWPMTFMSTMLAGFAAATLGVRVPFVEPAIWSSVIVLGVFVALQVKAPVRLGALIAGLFAFFHGHAHGAEAAAVSVVPYAAGFALATAGLHAAGIGLGLFAKDSIEKDALRGMVGLQRWARKL
jgi:urease accessory protein